MECCGRQWERERDDGCNNDWREPHDSIHNVLNNSLMRQVEPSPPSSSELAATPIQRLRAQHYVKRIFSKTSVRSPPPFVECLPPHLGPSSTHQIRSFQLLQKYIIFINFWWKVVQGLKLKGFSYLLGPLLTMGWALGQWCNNVTILASTPVDDFTCSPYLFCLVRNGSRHSRTSQESTLCTVQNVALACFVGLPPLPSLLGNRLSK